VAPFAPRARRMRARALSMRLAALAALAMLSLPCASATLIATSIRTRFTENSTEVEGDLYSVDPATGASQLVAPLHTESGAPVAVISLATHPRTGELYGATAGLTRIPRSLVTLDAQTGEVRVIGPLGYVASDIAFDRKGDLFAWLPEVNSLARIDLKTGLATPVGRSGIQGVMGGGMVIDDHDMAYVAATGATGTLDSVDIQTGQGTTGVDLQGAPYISAITNLTFSPAHVLYAVNSNMGSPASTSLVTIDPQTGKVTERGKLPPDSHALIFTGDLQGRDLGLRDEVLIALGVAAVLVVAFGFLRSRSRPRS
jgi:hypothetical protein